ncbi:hypothetical protein RQP46_003020 [Phenoliferia psychrophenolica]
MAPTPPPEREWTTPPLHLRCLDLEHPGVARFFAALPDPYKVLSSSCTTVLSLLYPPTLSPDSPTSSSFEADDSDASIAPLLPRPAPPKIRSVTFHLRAFDGVAHTNGSELDDAHKEIHISTNYLARIGGDPLQIRKEIVGVVVHELVHVFQWNGNGSCDGGVIEGVADWVRLGAGFGAPHWREEGGSDWKAGYATTAYFLVWLSRTLAIPLLVPELNIALRSHSYRDGKLLEKLLGGKDPQVLWKQYKKELEKGEVGASAALPAVPTHPPAGGYTVAYIETA